MSKARILSTPRAGVVELSAAIFSDMQNITPTSTPSPLIGGWLVCPIMGDPQRLLLCSYVDGVMFTWEGGEAEPVEVPPAERLETARWALAQAWQFERYYSGALVPFAEVGQAAAARMAGRTSVASMRYNLTFAYLSCWYGPAVAAPLDVGPPRARVLLGGWQG